VLADVDLILAEDTRRTGRLLSHFGIPAAGRLLSFHEHNEASRTAAVLERLADGAAVALVSDAGTPVLSDPGFELVRMARERGVAVLSVPGPSAFAAALAASGQPPLPATLAGFLPQRAGPRARRIAELARVPWTLVIPLSPHRLQAEIRALAEGLGADRPATLLAEISKRHERAVTGSLGEIAGDKAGREARGEYILVVGPAAGRPAGGASEDVDAGLVRAVYAEAVRRGMARAEALRWTAARLGLDRRTVFDLLRE
jgi:Predicted methyltransferases